MIIFVFYEFNRKADRLQTNYPLFAMKALIGMARKEKRGKKVLIKDKE